MNVNGKVYPMFTFSHRETRTDSNDGKQPEKSSLTDEVCTFAGETTLHGIRYVGNRSICAARRYIWCILVFIALAFLVIILKESVVNYRSYPVATKISIAHYDEIAFPAVTFCNYNQLRQSQVSDEELKYIRAFFSGNYANFSNINNWNLTELYLRASHSINDLLTKCTWMSLEDCGPENFTTDIMDFGVCYTFKTTRNVSVAGVSSSLFLQININDTDHTGHEQGIKGIKMMIHPADELPLVKSFGFSVSPGFHTEIALKGVQTKSLPHPYSSKCTGKELQYTGTYTKALCIEECRFDYVVAKCGCKLTNMIGDVPECTVLQTINCGDAAYNRFVSDRNVSCDCPVACDQLTYEPRTSSTLWPDPATIQLFENNDGYTKDYVRENILQVSISFEDLDMTVVELVPSYSVTQLLSELGGNMGLICGMSLITIVELLDFVIVAILQRLMKKKEFRPTKTHTISK
ncbi:acid-sensing ion channel 1-like [Antedon mediterranea]|uniref:acid-sensing ion channel 1-like n=1 Tax=Antedon mediterranea TaxID=105859 RepID=UPI003AF6486E